MKIVFVLVLSVLLSGCEEQTVEGHKIKKEGSSRFLCVDGVKYMQWDRGITVMLDTNSKVIPCK